MSDYLHLSFFCGGLAQRQFERQDGHSRSGQGGGVPGAFTWNTPERMKTWDLGELKSNCQCFFGNIWLIIDQFPDDPFKKPNTEAATGLN